MTEPTNSNEPIIQYATPAPAPLVNPVTFNPKLAEDPIAAAKALSGTARAIGKLMSPADRARFLMALDTNLYWQHGESAIEANGGLHPKHRLMDYHRFFTTNITRGERVLDLGSGIGELACKIAGETGAHITGMDWEPKNVARANARAKELNLPNLSFIVGDITKDDITGVLAPQAGTLTESKPIDVIILSNVLEHLMDRPQLLRHWTKLHHPDRFLIRVPMYDRDWRTPWKEELDIEWRLDLTHFTEYTHHSFREEMELAGLAIRSLYVQWGEIYAVVVPNPQSDTNVEP